MKKLFLIIPLFTASIYVSGDECPSSLIGSKLQLAPYIHRVINSNEGTGPFRLEALQKLVGIRVTGQHWFYPKGQSYKQGTSVDGVIQDVAVIKPSEDPRAIIYEMTISSEENGLQRISFSGSYSPAFSVLETDQVLSGQLAEKVAAVQDIKSPFDLLSIGLDTPPEVADYKNTLRSQGAVVFDGEQYSYYELSSSYERPLVIKGEIWSSVDHYLEAQKFVDSEGVYTKHAFDIRVAASPAEAVRIGRERSHLIRSDWEEVRDEVMFKALTAKFTQYKDLYRLLMDTEDAFIIKHTGEDHYWDDGEDGSGRSMLGDFLMKLRDQFRQDIMPGYELPISTVAVWGQLLLRIENLGFQDAYDMAEQIALSNINDIEKIDRMQMILNSEYFFTRSGHENHTSSSEWIALIDRKYPEDVDFKYQLVKMGVSFPSLHVVITLNNLNIPHDQKMEIYKIMAHQSVVPFMNSLDNLDLSHSEIKKLYLYCLQFEVLTIIIKRLPKDIVDDNFI